MNRLRHSRTRVRNITLSPYTSFYSSKHSVGVFFSFLLLLFHKKFHIDELLDFHPSHESGRATQHGHTQTELRGKPIDIERRVQSCSIWEGSRSIIFHSFPTPTIFPGTVRAVPLFYSHTSYTCNRPWGPIGSWEVGTPAFSRLTDGGENVSLTRRPPFTSRKITGTHFCYRMSRH
jgi:hypothetical protein